MYETLDEEDSVGQLVIRPDREEKHKKGLEKKQSI